MMTLESRQRGGAIEGYQTVGQVAKRYGVAEGTVRYWCREGLLAGAVKMGEKRRGVWLIPETALEGFEPPRGPQERTG